MDQKLSSGAWLSHRLSRDIDFVCHDGGSVRTFAREHNAIALESDCSLALMRDAGQDLPNALEKNVGIDPAIVVWLLQQFPTSPLPTVLVRIGEQRLRNFRDDLAERMRRLNVEVDGCRR